MLDRFYGVDLRENTSYTVKAIIWLTELVWPCWVNAGRFFVPLQVGKLTFHNHPFSLGV